MTKINSDVIIYLISCHYYIMNSPKRINALVRYISRDEFGPNMYEMELPVTVEGDRLVNAYEVVKASIKYGWDSYQIWQDLNCLFDSEENSKLVNEKINTLESLL